MYHLIEFAAAFTVDVEISRRQRLERLRVEKGTRACACVFPYVRETPQGPVEVADLCLEDGALALGVRFDQFRCVE